LVLWEAQFGDFADGAQSILDEFISSGEAKWGQHSGLTLLLPHGYEGQGPDHSSARIERYLLLCAEDNMTVAVPSTPAQYFHLLRRQALTQPPRPLIVFTPKSMLRLRAAASVVESFTSGGWKPVIRDDTVERPSRIVLCSGKVYYDLLAARGKRSGGADNADDIALVRVEQLYPTPVDEVSEVLASYGVGTGGTTDVAWVQEEPANQGAWPHVAMHLIEGLPEGVRLRRVSRSASASPAAGVATVHEAEQAALIEAALGR
jgi:2-oxoglutarate dehydrogenase E1 component